MGQWWLVAVTALCGFALLWIRLSRVGQRPAGYPPGPPTIPILGNIHLMPSRDIHKQFQKWAQEYGPVYSLILGTQTWVVLSNDEAIKELIDRRSAIYSSRLDMYVGQTLCSGGLRFLMMAYGPTWRTVRKTIHNLLNVNAARSYLPYQMLENKQMLHDMLKQPDDFLEHVRRYSNSLTTSLVYGWRSPTYDNADVKQLFDGFEEFGILNQNPAALLADFFPVLRSLPAALLPTKAKSIAHHQEERKLYTRHWMNAKGSVQNGTANPSFCASAAREQGETGFSDPQAAYNAGTLLEAGSDTTANTLYAFIQALVVFPEVQQKAFEEVERVIGSERLPTMDDHAKLPYIQQCVKESLRWMPTTPLGGVPHCVTEDDEYLGYRIPKGAGVVINTYTIHMDPKRYPQPRRFNPDRFDPDKLQSAADSANSSDVSQRDHFGFGSGRRICPGMHVAERSLFLAISRLVWAFDVSPAVDDTTGDPIMPDPEKLTQGFVCLPEPFPARIRPRSEAKAEIIEREWREARQLLDPVTQQWNVVPSS